MKKIDLILYSISSETKGKPGGFRVLQIGKPDNIKEVFDGNRDWPVREHKSDNKYGFVRIVTCIVIPENT